MSKLAGEDKIAIYHIRKSWTTISSLRREYRIVEANIKYLIRIIDKHDEGILKRDKNNYYTPLLKEEIDH